MLGLLQTSLFGGLADWKLRGKNLFFISDTQTLGRQGERDKHTQAWDTV